MSRRVVEVAPARLEAWLARFEANNPGPDARQRVVSVDRFDSDPLAMVLVRRGGYAVALAGADHLLSHKVGTRYVQSRTAAGGWSQQRFARRRANQADALVGAVAGHLVRILADRPEPAGLVTGGDRRLVADVLTDSRLAYLLDLPTREVPDLPDPNATVLRTALERARAVRVTIEE